MATKENYTIGCDYNMISGILNRCNIGYHCESYFRYKQQLSVIRIESARGVLRFFFDEHGGLRNVV